MARRTPLVTPRATISHPYVSIFTNITVWLKHSPTEIRCGKGHADAAGTARILPEVLPLALFPCDGSERASSLPNSQPGQDREPQSASAVGFVDQLSAI